MLSAFLQLRQHRHSLRTRRRQRATRSHTAPMRPAVEVLEDRTLLSTFTVENTNDSGAGSLRDAVDQANATSGPDQIVFDAALNGGTITLTTGALGITDELIINGPGANLLTIDGNGSFFQIFLVSDFDAEIQTDVEISGLTLTNAGDSAIENDEILTIREVTITNSRTSGAGGGISNRESLTVIDSTIANNRAESGGGILSTGDLTVNQSTLSGNSASEVGGAIQVEGASLSIIQSTITGNTSTVFGGSIQGDLSSTLTLKNSIVAGNTAGAQIDNFDVVPGNNLIQTDASAILDPVLGDNGGLTPTHVLITNSAAIDAGDDAEATSAGLAFDQRGPGFDRISGDGVDIGAFEFQTGQPTGGTISGQKYHDLDGDGVHDAGEPGLDGWTIQLFDAENNLIAETITASNDLNGDGDVDPHTEQGLYEFNNVVPGKYEIHEVLRDGWVQTAPRGFGMPMSFPTGINTRAVVAADLNGDDIPDVATANYTAEADKVSVLFGRGDGTLADPISYQTGFASDRSNAITAGDLDGDGDIDLAVTSDSDLSGIDSLSILLNNGDGTFVTPASGSPQRIDLDDDDPNSIQAADVDQDGDIDLVYMHGSVSVLLNDGNAAFAPATVTTFTDVQNATAVAIADLTGDGLPDLAVAERSFTGPEQIELLSNNGDSTFGPPQQIAALPTLIDAAIVAEDFDGDGKIDLAASTDSGTHILLNAGTGVFGEPVSLDVRAAALTVTDLDGDGDVDLAAADSAGGLITRLLNRGDGSFIADTPIVIEPVGSSIVTADFDRDGGSDVAVARFNEVAVLLNRNGFHPVTIRDGEELDGLDFGNLSFVVNSTADPGDGVPDENERTLREVIEQQNPHIDGLDVIRFDIPADDPRHFYYQDDGIAGQVSRDYVAVTAAEHDATLADIDPDWPHSWWSIDVAPEMPLPTITEAITIDGYTQPGARANSNAASSGLGLNGVLRVEITNTSAPFSVGLSLDTHDDETLLRGLAISGFSNGVQVRSGRSRIQGNYLGADVSGTLAISGTDLSISAAGAEGRHLPLLIGGTKPVERNLIFGGLTAILGGGIGTRIEGNLIGLNAAGTATLRPFEDKPFQAPLVGIDAGWDIVIGGTDPDARNVISGASVANIGFDEGRGSVQGNFIGTDVTGSEFVPSRSPAGTLIQIAITTDENVIGGTQSGAGNVIAGGTLGSLDVRADHNIIQGNLIGVDLSGTTPLQPSFIEAGNAGIGISGDANLIGGTAVGAGNVIAYNTSAGIFVADETLGNAFLQNSIFANGGLGIDLHPHGVNPNDAGDVDTGANALQNFPMLRPFERTATQTLVEGSLNSLANSDFRIEFFSSPAADPTGFGEGKDFLGSAEVTTDENGRADFSVTLDVTVPDGHVISATATRLVRHPEGDEFRETSEFSRAVGEFGDQSRVQIVTPRQTEIIVPDGAGFRVVADYTTSDDDPTLTGLGVRLHFDSSIVAFERLSDVLETEFVRQQVLSDEEDFDNDPATDQFLLVGWADIEGAWPNETLPAELFTANFRVREGIVNDTVSTLRFTAASTAASHGFSSTPVQLTVGPEGLDVDNNGAADALTDGMLILRYLLGLRGEALVQVALAMDANRTDPDEIVTYLEAVASPALDADGNGTANPLTDGALILRYLLGFRGHDLVNEAIDPRFATRPEPDAIAAFLDKFHPNPPETFPVDGGFREGPLGRELFEPPVNYTAGSGPSSVTVADLDGDGDADLAVVNEFSGDIAVLLNDGRGIFAAPVRYAVGDNPASVQSDDLDGDGDVDLAVANASSDSVSVLLNDGTGNFAPAVDYAAGDFPTSVAIGDVEGDGDLDLLVANSESNQISVLLNDGNGVFAAPDALTTGFGPRSVVTADFDGDGNVDLAVAVAGSVSVLLSVGGGNFAPPIDFPAGDRPADLTAVDFDSDGDVDLAVTNSEFHDVSVLLNDGNGTFLTAGNYPVGIGPRAVRNADVDNDGDSDLVVALLSEGSIAVLRNDGNGIFSAPEKLPVGIENRSVANADLDGDGDVDLVTASRSPDGVSILRNQTIQNYRQIISASPDSQLLAPGESFAIDVDYTRFPFDETAIGLGLRMHFDTSLVDFNGLSNRLDEGFLLEAVMDDTADFDNDPATDQFALVTFFDISGQWPGEGTLPARLFRAIFTAGIRNAITSINFTAHTSRDAILDARSVSVEIGPVNRWVAPADGDWNNPGNWSTGSVPAAEETVIIDLAESDVEIVLPEGDVAINALISHESLVLPGTLSVQKDALVAGVDATGSAQFDVGGDLTVSGGVFDNAGRSTVGGDFTVRNGAEFHNLESGRLENTIGSGLADDFIITDGSLFENAGIVQLNGSTGFRLSREAEFRNLESGALENTIGGCLADDFIITDGSLFENAGTLELQNLSELTITGNSTLENLVGGTFRFLAAPDELGPEHALRIADGSLLSNAGTLELQNIERLTITGGSTLDNVENSMAQLDVCCTFTAEISSSSLLRNAGVFEMQNPDLLAITGSSILENLAGGTFRFLAPPDELGPEHALRIADGSLLANAGTLELQNIERLTITGGSTLDNVENSIAQLDICCTFTAEISSASVLRNAGVFSTSGPATFQGLGDFLNPGEVRILAETLTLTDGSSSGRFQIAGGAVLNFAGNFFLEAGSLLSGGGIVRIDPPLDNGRLLSIAGDLRLPNLELGEFGTMQVLSGTTTLVGAGFSSGRFQIADGAELNLAGDFIIQDGTEFSGTGLFQIDPLVAGSTVVIETDLSLDSLTLGPLADIRTTGTLSSTTGVMVTGTQVLGGTGTIQSSVTNSSIISPGLSPGALTFEGNYTQTAEGVLEIEIAGTIPGVEHDQLNITGTAFLDGTLEILVIDGFIPSHGDEFVILTFADRQGDFATINGLDAGNGFVFAPVFDSTSLTLVAEDIQPPQFPAGSLMASNVSESSATLTWTAAEDNDEVVEYAILRNGVEIATTPADLLTFDVTGLISGTVHNFSIQAEDAAGNLRDNGPMLSVETLEGEGNDIIVTAPGAGISPTVQVTSAMTNEELYTFDAYDTQFLGGVRVAAGDVNGDGAPDIITGAGPGGGPHVKVFDGTDPAQELYSFFAFEDSFTVGLFVAAADLDGDNRADIIVGADAGGEPRVRVFSGADGTELFSLLAYDERFRGGVRVAAGDITGDGTPDIITGAGPGGGPHVRVFDGITGEAVPGDIGSFMAYEEGFRGGVFVAAGRVNADSHVDLITGAGAGGGPHVRVFEGATGRALAGAIGSFFAFEDTFRGGVRVAATDVNGDGQADILAAQGPGGDSTLRAFDANSSGDVVDELFNVSPANAGASSSFVAGSTELSSGLSLRLAQGFSPASDPQVLNLSEARPAFDAALRQLETAGLSEESIAERSTFAVHVNDLSGDQLGIARPGEIVLDVNAAGVGWFIDPIPDNDGEFAETDGVESAAIGQVDLLTVLVHELLHQLGQQHSEEGDFSNELMAETLTPGIRLLPSREDIDELFSDSNQFESLLDPTLPGEPVSR